MYRRRRCPKTASPGELIEAVGARYRGAATSEKKTILDEFVTLRLRRHMDRCRGE